MKKITVKTLLLVLILTVSIKGFSQPQPMIDLNSGEWKVFGTVNRQRSEKEIDNFFTDNKRVMEVLEKSSSPFREGMHVYLFDYLLTFVKDDSIVFKKELNFYFNKNGSGFDHDSLPENVINTIKKIKKIPVSYYETDSLEQARKLYHYVRSKKDLWIEFYEDSSWMVQPGYAVISDSTYPYSYNDEDQAKALNYVIDKITTHYPDEKFKVNRWSSQGTLQKYRIFCSEKLGNELKKLFDSVHQRWIKLHDISLRIYGLDEKEIENILEMPK